MKTSADADTLARDEIIYLPVSSIDPDPDQPRLVVDDELADSIKQHGVLQAIEVRPHPSGADDRWMLVDGERRYQGAKRAHLKTIPATITLDVEDAADRIVRQIVRNEGRPLTPVEEALAFKKIIDTRHAGGDKKYGVVQLARELGIAKSTIGDRLALTEIPAFWLELIAKGPLQASHAPILHKWRKVPEKYQRAALAQMQKDYRWTQRRKGSDRLYGDVLQSMVDQYLPKFTKPLADVPGYEGPTETLSVHNAYPPRRAVHAMDPSKWGPIWRKGIAARKAKDAKRNKGGGAPHVDDWQEKNRIATEEAHADRAAWPAKVPTLLAELAAAINAGTLDERLEQLLVDGEKERHDRDTRSYLGLVPLADVALETPERHLRSLMRFLAFSAIAYDIADDWQGPRDWPKIERQLGLAPPKAEKKKRGKKAAAPDPAAKHLHSNKEADDDVDEAPPTVRECKYCLCTEDKACELEGGLPCRWHDSTVPVCSNPSCVASYQEDVEASADDAGDAQRAVDTINAEIESDLEEIEA